MRVKQSAAVEGCPRTILWVGEGKALGEIARLLGVSAKTVWNWLKRLMVQGLGWLVGQHYRGRGCKAKLSGTQKQALYEWVVAGPQANGVDCGVWTSAMLVELICGYGKEKYKILVDRAARRQACNDLLSHRIALISSGVWQA